MKINGVVLGIFLFCFFSVAIVPVVHGASTPPYTPDERFGLGGVCSTAQDLSIPWVQGWGHGTNYANQAELETCMKADGLKAFLTLGKLDNGHQSYTNADMQNMYNIPSLENKFLSDPKTTPEEKGWYNDVLAVLHDEKVRYGNSGECPHPTIDPATLGVTDCYDNAKSSFLLIKYKYTNSNPSSTTSVEGGGQKSLAYKIANEPDTAGPVITPANYATYYHAFYSMIKKYDPTAQVMVGGVTSEAATGYPSPPAPIPPSCHFYPDNCASQWVFDFIDAYQSKYGGQPPVDIWGVHIYDYPWTNVRDRAIWFRDLLDHNGYTGVPIWLTEMSSLAHDGNISIPKVTVNKGPYYDFRLPSETMASAILRINQALLTPAQRETEYALMAHDYMPPLINWFKGDGKTVIAKWFWFYSPHFYSTIISVENGHEKLVFDSTDTVGTIYKRIGSPEYNPLGVTYTQLMDIPVLVNKGFETSTVTPYGYWFWLGSPQAHEEIDTTEKNTGNQSIKISVGSAAGSYGYTSAIVQTMKSPSLPGKGKYVQFSVWCKTAPGATASIKIDITDAAGVRNSYWLPGVTQPVACPTWQQIKTNIVQIPQGTTKLDLNALPTGQNAVVWFDDFNIDECPYQVQGDANCDDTVTFTGDFPILANELAKLDTLNKADFNRDGKVNLQDFEILRRTLFPNP